MGRRRSDPALARNLVLIGNRGCGKSSVAKRLARENRHFMLLSLDALIRYEARGRSIAQIVRNEGWKGFRARELEVVRKVAWFRGGALVDTGGGVVVELDARGDERYGRKKVEALRRHGWIVYLRRDANYLARRSHGDEARPSLSDSESVRDISLRRDPWYRRAADCVIDCEGLEKTEIAKRVLESYYAAPGVIAPAPARRDRPRPGRGRKR